jgi:hypothetical protein
MSSQKVANNPLGSYPVLVDITSDGSQIQNVRNVSTIVYIDDVSGTVSYYGFASPGTPTNYPYWRIMKKETSSTVTSYLYANGTLDYSAIWDDRASLSYS